MQFEENAVFNNKINEGKRRLRLFLSILAAVISYIFLCVTEWDLDQEDIFFFFPLISALFFLILFFLVTAIYWVLEGFENEAKENDQILFDICLSGSESLLKEKSRFKDQPVEDNDLLSKMKGDLSATFMLASISYSFGLVCYSALKIDVDFLSSDLGKDFTRLVLYKLIEIDATSFDKGLDDEKVIARSKKAINDAVEAAEHMQRAPRDQFLKLLEAIATLYCSKIFENEVKKIGSTIKTTRNLIKTNDKLIKNCITS